jgi:hypothetical protein
MQTQKIIQIAKDMAAALKADEFELIAFGTTTLSGILDCGIHIQHDQMEEFAPLADWTLNVKRSDQNTYPFEHSVIVDGVRVFCITKEPIEINEAMISAAEDVMFARRNG